MITLGSMANSTVANCSALVSRKSFPDYVAAIRKATANDFALVDQCRPEVCNALWGSGNPDISGVGVSQVEQDFSHYSNTCEDDYWVRYRERSGVFDGTRASSLPWKSGEFAYY